MQIQRKTLNSTKFDASILVHPNIPKPLHGVNPRTIMGEDKWRELSFHIRGIHAHCQACGESKFTTGPLECHEEYIIHYEVGISKFKRYVAICKQCHEFIHCGRLKALARSGKITRHYYGKIMKRGRNILKKEKLKKIKYEGKMAEWNDWKLIFEGQEYKPIYKTHGEWKLKYATRKKIK